MRKLVFIILSLVAASIACCVLICLGSVIWYYVWAAKDEKAYLAENHENFYAVINYMKDNPIQGCEDVEPPVELLDWNKQKTILVCMYDNGAIEWMMFNNPFGAKDFTYIENETELPRGRSIANLPYGGSCSYKLEKEWFLCDLSGR